MSASDHLSFAPEKGKLGGGGISGEGGEGQESDVEVSERFLGLLKAITGAPDFLHSPTADTPALDGFELFT